MILIDPLPPLSRSASFTVVSEIDLKHSDFLREKVYFQHLLHIYYFEYHPQLLFKGSISSLRRTVTYLIESITSDMSSYI
jgi:hypothetical protein